MKWIFPWILLCVFSVYAGNPVLKKFHNFGQEENFGTFKEMKNWAKYQLMEVSPDHPGYGLKDGLFAWIRESGLEFVLQSDTSEKKQIFLYLDLLQFSPLNESAVMVPGVLNVYLNNKLETRIYSDARKNFTNPVKIQVDPSQLQNKRLFIRLVPGYGRAWGIWDAFLVSGKP